MTIQESLKGYFGKYAELEQINAGAYRLYAPFFHEDGDMYSIYLEVADDRVVVRDYGNALMRVSYTFDVNTPARQGVLNRIVTSNMAEIDDGELLLRSSVEDAPEAVMRFAQLVSKVSSIDMLSREVARSMFYEYLGDFIGSRLERFNIQKKVCPTSDTDLTVDYVIGGREPLYLFGVKDDSKASKVVISCLHFQKQKLPFRSVIIHEDIDSLSRFNRRQITNVSDKQFYSFEDFTTEGEAYLDRVIASA